MGLGEEELDKIKTAGSLHDLGKIGVRDDILLKAGPLTDDEYAAIKLHPSMGASILAPIDSMSDIIPAILSHHERMDGRGYPQALPGNKIPLIARILAVADTFDAPHQRSSLSAIFYARESHADHGRGQGHTTLSGMLAGLSFNGNRLTDLEMKTRKALVRVMRKGFFHDEQSMNRK